MVFCSVVIKALAVAWASLEFLLYFTFFFFLIFFFQKDIAVIQREWPNMSQSTNIMEYCATIKL